MHDLSNRWGTRRVNANLKAVWAEFAANRYVHRPGPFVTWQAGAR